MTEVQSGLEGVVAFASTIAEPDRDGGALRYRGVDIEELAGRVPYEQVWGLLVDDALTPGLPAVEPRELPVRSGDARADVQVATALLAPELGLHPLIDDSDERVREDLGRVSALMLDFVAQSARGADLAPVPPATSGTAAERFLTRWRGEADPRHAKAIDAYWTS
ncbi:MAG TPA: citrate/2-methylcitrate synthase, partial [Solirubrobacter sp.]